MSVIINLRLKTPKNDDITDDQIETTGKILKKFGELLLADAKFRKDMQYLWLGEK